MLEYIEYLTNTHKAIRAILISSGKTYRSHKVAWENGYLNALADVADAIKQPEREQELRKILKEQG